METIHESTYGDSPSSDHWEQKDRGYLCCPQVLDCLHCRQLERGGLVPQCCINDRGGQWKAYTWSYSPTVVVALHS